MKIKPEGDSVEHVGRVTESEGDNETVRKVASAQEKEKVREDMERITGQFPKLF